MRSRHWNDGGIWINSRNRPEISIIYEIQGTIADFMHCPQLLGVHLSLPICYFVLDFLVSLYRIAAKCQEIVTVFAMYFRY